MFIQVSDWNKHRTNIMAAGKRGAGDICKRKMSQPTTAGAVPLGRKAKYPEKEKDLVKWIMEQRSRSRCVWVFGHTHDHSRFQTLVGGWAVGEDTK